jgi:DNA-directed RNA polymerase subunit omega
MARISSEKAVDKIGNRYDMVLIASQRARELKLGDEPKLESENGPVITAIREIEEGLIDRNYLFKVPSSTRHRKI